jgi:hypothetical protein
MSMQCKHGTLGGFLLGLYVYIGFVLLIAGQGLWYESLTELGITSHCPFTLEESKLWSIYLLPSIIPVFIITSGFKCKLFSLNFPKKFFSTEADLATLLNVIVIFALYPLLCYCIPFFFSPYNIGYVFCIAGIVGISTFYYIHPPMWEVLKSENEERYIEALKLEHDWIWRALQIISWAVVILVTSAILASWSQLIYPIIPLEKRASPTFTTLQAWSVVQIAYLLIGLWFGIVGRLMDYSWRIRKRIAGVS